MISLRTVTTTFVALASLTLAACSDAPVAPVSKGIAPSAASFDGKVGSTGNSAKNGDIDVRVLLDKSGNALLVVRTGSYNPTTNVASPDGYFTNIQYKIYDASGKQVQVKNVNFSKTGVDYYWTYINLCGSSSDDDDDDDDAGKSSSSCSSHYALNWSVSVQANLKGVGGDTKKTDVVREDGIDGYLPDVDIATQKLYVVGTGGAQTIASSVPAAAPVTYSVPFPNNKAINGVANTIGVTTTCLVYVDNVLQLAIPNIGIYNPFTHSTIYTNPNLFSYTSGSSQQINAGATGACQFSLSLPAGSHTVAVSALVTSPGDYDLSNNTTTQFQVTASSGPPDVQVLGSLVQKNATTGLYEAPNLNSPTGAAVATTLYQQIAQKALTTPASVVCKVTVDGTDLTTQPAVAPALNGVASTGYCAIPMTLAVGSHTIVVTAISTPTDGDATNNTATSTVVVANVVPISGTLGSTLSLTNGSTKTSIVTTAANVLSGSSNHYSADISLTNLLGMTGLVPVTCSVAIDGHAFDANSSISFVASGNTTTAAIVWDATNGQTTSVGNGSSAPCGFSLTLSESGNADVPHTIVVTAKSTVLNPTSPVTTSTTGKITDLVRVDLSADGFFQQSGSSWVTPVPISLGASATIGLKVHNPDATHQETVNCSITGDGVTNTNVSGYVAGTQSNITIAAGGDGFCTWTVTPNALQSLSFTATATPVAGVAPRDSDLTNNTYSGTISVKSNGRFTGFDPSATGITQEWYTTTGQALFPVEKLVTQAVQVTRLALLVVPTSNGTIGHYKLTSHATSNVTTNGVSSVSQIFPTGIVFGNLNAVSSAAGTDCTQISASPGTPFPAVSDSMPAGLPLRQAAMPAGFSYYASVCTEQTTVNGNPNFQQITVNFTQSFDSNQQRFPLLNPQTWAIQPGFVDVALRLDFKLPGSQADFVAGTIRIVPGKPLALGASSDPQYSGMLEWHFDSSLGASATILP